MTVDEVSALIGNLGFPIVACCVMFYLYYQLSNTVAGLNTTIEKLYTFNVTEKVLNELGRVMERLMEVYVDKRFKSLEILETLT